MFDQPGSKPELVDQQVALILELMCLGVVQRHEAAKACPTVQLPGGFEPAENADTVKARSA